MAKSPVAHVLIVEDDGELLEVLKFVLEDGGYKVAMASDGAAALRVVASTPIDLVVLDVHMKGMSGLDVARRLRSQSNTSRLLIALHTGVPEEEIRKEFVDYDLFRPKADDADVLLGLVASAVSQTRSFEQAKVR